MPLNHSNPRRGVAALIIAGVTVVALAACSSGGSSGKSSAKPGPVTITFAFQAETAPDPIKAVVAKFEKANPLITVNVVEDPTDQYPKTLATQLQGGNGPDLFYVTGGSGVVDGVLSLAKAGYLRDLTKEPFAGKIPKSSQGLYISKGKQWGATLGVQVVPLIVNKTSYKALGLTTPTTESALLKQCAVASAAGKNLITLGAGDGANSGLAGDVVAASTVYASDPNWNAERAAGKTTFAKTKGWHQALQFFLDAEKDGCFQKSAAADGYTQIFPPFATGTSTQMFAPAKVLAIAPTINPKATFTLAPFPGITAANTRTLVSTNDGIAINAHSSAAKQAAAVKLVEYFESPTIDRYYATITGQLSLTDYNKGTLPPAYQPLAKYMTAKTSLPYVSAAWPNGGVQTALGQGIQGLLTGQATVDQVLANLDAAWDQQ